MTLRALLLKISVSLLIPAVLLPLVLSCGPDPSGEGITLYAAASLQDVLDEAVRAYSDSLGIPVRIRYGGSGTLARLIEQGAPADAYLAADPEWMEYLASRGRAVEEEFVLAGNRLVVIVPRDRARGVGDPVHGADHVSIGDPETVPAGRYALQALNRLWDPAPTRLVYAPDARTALARVERGEAGAGIVYRTDALASDRVAITTALPRTSHDPILYPARVVSDASGGKQATAFLRFLVSPRGRRMFDAHGFESP